MRGFKAYLDTKARTKSDTLLAPNTKYAYYNKFKACINSAYNDGYLAVNPCRKVKSFEMVDSQREYLLFEELQALASAECKYPTFKNSLYFLMSNWFNVERCAKSNLGKHT